MGGSLSVYAPTGLGLKNVAKRITPNSEYDPFARIYNRHWGVAYRTEAFPIVQRLLLSRLKEGSAVLDVCCGTGQFTEQVRQQGFEMAGIDSSSEMIAFARQNAPEVNLAVADARSFALGRKFAAAYSVFESLNHVPDLEGLHLAFRCVRKHLKRGAPFLFDLNREEAFILYWNTIDALVEDESVLVLRMDYDDQTRVGECRMTAFEKDRNWVRKDFTIRQTCHDHDEVEGTLRDAGFNDVTRYDARDAGMAGDAGYARTFFLATG
jgi:SAM-dependent methyltransferase